MERSKVQCSEVKWRGMEWNKNKIFQGWNVLNWNIKKKKKKKKKIRKKTATENVLINILNTTTTTTTATTTTAEIEI